MPLEGHRGRKGSRRSCLATHLMPRTRKHALPKPRGGEGAGGAAAAGERAGEGTSTDSTPAINSPSYNSNGHSSLTTAFTSPEAKAVWEQAARDAKPNWTPSRDNPPAYAVPTIPSIALATAEQQEAFAEAVVEHEGIRPASRAWGLKPAAVFLHAAKHPEFQKSLYAAQAANFENQVYKLDELCNHLLDMPPREMNQCANAYGRVFDYRMRIVGRLLPKYSEHQGTQVNIQNNTGIVCDEETRARLISLNQKLLTATTEQSSGDTKQLGDIHND